MISSSSFFRSERKKLWLFHPHLTCGSPHWTYSSGSAASLGPERVKGKGRSKIYWMDEWLTDWLNTFLWKWQWMKWKASHSFFPFSFLSFLSIPIESWLLPTPFSLFLTLRRLVIFSISPSLLPSFFSSLSVSHELAICQKIFSPLLHYIEGERERELAWLRPASGPSLSLLLLYTNLMAHAYYSNVMSHPSVHPSVSQSDSSPFFNEDPRFFSSPSQSLTTLHNTNYNNNKGDGVEGLRVRSERVREKESGAHKPIGLYVCLLALLDKNRFWPMRHIYILLLSFRRARPSSLRTF